MTLRQTARTLCIFALLRGVVHPQSMSSDIIGAVTDPAGASAPGAEVQV
jgi:hypothetical protein